MIGTVLMATIARSRCRHETIRNYGPKLRFAYSYNTVDWEIPAVHGSNVINGVRVLIILGHNILYCTSNAHERINHLLSFRGHLITLSTDVTSPPKNSNCPSLSTGGQLVGALITIVVEAAICRISVSFSRSLCSPNVCSLKTFVVLNVPIAQGVVEAVGRSVVVKRCWPSDS